MGVENAGSAWQTGVGTLLLLLLSIAVVTDARRRRIPNVLVLVTLAAGMLVHSFGPPAPGAGGLFTTQPGALGGWLALAGAATGLLLFLPLYLLRLMGAGDVKLLAAVGSFAGPSAFLNLALLVLVAGGLLALARMAYARNSRTVMRNALATLGQMLPGSAGSFDARTQTAWRMPYAVAIAGGVLAYGAWTLSGRAPFLNV